MATSLATPYLPSTMSDAPLEIGAILRHAVRAHPQSGITSRDGGGFVRYTYPEFAGRVAQLAHVLRGLGVGPGDRVASFAWNGHRHLELYYAVPMIGAVLHTVNIRLFPEQVAYVLDHAEDDVVFLDGSLTAAFAPALAKVERPLQYVVMGTAASPLEGALDYEMLLAAQPAHFDFPSIDERAAAIICYTSATTGDPKAVAFSHRSTYLHAMAVGLADSFGVRKMDRLLPIVPMFHVNAWGCPFVGPLVGAELIMPMERLDPAGVIELVERERVTMSAGVPTVWMAVRDALRAQNATLPTLKRLVIGGSAAPPSLVDDLEAMGIDVVHAWGMTEMSPIGTLSRPTPDTVADTQLARREKYKQGRFCPIVEYRVVDERGAEVPSDGVARGELLVRGFAVAKAYYNNERATAAAFEDGGWFHTGDVVTVDPHGFMEIVDRVKDFIKSGGEWISSVEVENAIMGHPAVKEAAVFGVPHAKWLERPVAAVVTRDGAALDEDALRAWLLERLAKFQVPDRVVFLDAIPRTGVGKFLKRDLRDRYAKLLT